MSPVAPTIVAIRPVRGATGVITTECSVLVSTIKVNDWPLTFIETVGSRGPRINKPGLSLSDSVPARPKRFWTVGSGWYLSVLGRLNFLDPLDIPLQWGHSFLQCLVSLQWAHWSWHRGGLFLVSAASRAAFCFIFFTCFFWASWSQFTKTLFATSRICVTFIPAEAFQLLELSLDVCTGLSHKGSVNHPLIISCLRVKQGLCLEHFTVFHRNSWGSHPLFGLSL